MGNKVNPKGLRLGIIHDWDCNWYAGKEYKDLVLQDFHIRRFLKDELSRAGVALVKISRKAGLTEATVYVARTGIIFGRRGIDLAYIKDEIVKSLKIKA